MRKVPTIDIKLSKNDFKFGACVGIAVSQAFDIPIKHFDAICSLIDINYEDGLTFWECTKLINHISKAYKLPIPRYKSNYANLEYGQLVYTMDRGKFLYMFDPHLSYVEDGVIYDSFLSESITFSHMYLETPPTGWWVINN